MQNTSSYYRQNLAKDLPSGLVVFLTTVGQRLLSSATSQHDSAVGSGCGVVDVGFKFTTPALYKAQWKLGLNQFFPFAATIAAVLTTDLLIGVTVGLAIGIFFVLKAHYKLPFLKESHAEAGAESLNIQLGQNETFLNKASLVAELSQIPESSNVTIDGSKSHFIDYDVLEAIQDLKTAQSISASK